MSLAAKDVAKEERQPVKFTRFVKRVFVIVEYLHAV